MGIWDKFYERARSFFAESGSAEPKSRCYYDLLEVSRDATDDEIKRSFKRLALKWHPDKNRERAEECTAYFVLIQQAYEVLIDPQERAFYDRHRENIIHQEDGDVFVDVKRDTGINLDPYMNTACFRAGLFSSEAERDENFYTVYRNLFHQLAAEEYAYIEDPDERNFPVFGKASSDYDTVVSPFYAFWLDFNTQRSFAWLDKWDLRRASDRPTARAMEKENKKLREQGRKQRSEDVRKLVEFVRKHDKRVGAAKERQKERIARAQQLAEEQRRQTIRRNLENLDQFECDEKAHQQHLATLEEIEQALDAEFGILAASPSQIQYQDELKTGTVLQTIDDEQKQFRCIVCEKSFKTRQVFDNHQRSKKHRQMVELLRQHMREEDQILFEGEDEDKVDESDEKEAEQQIRRKKRKRTKKIANEEEDRAVDGQEGKEKEGPAEESAIGKENEEAMRDEKGAPTIMKKNKRQQKRKDNKNERKDIPAERPAGPVASECITCGAQFESKTKLHAHLRDSGHAILKHTAATTSVGGTKKGKKKSAGTTTNVIS